jgi:hypothetical protein
VIVKHVEIKPKQVIRKFEFERTERFVRNADKWYRIVAEMLAEIRLDRAHMRTSDQQIVNWVKQIKRFSKQLAGGEPPIVRLYTLIKWYKDHYDDDEYIPRVESATSLVSKFERLEAAMLRRVKLKTANGHDLSIKQVLQQNGITHPRIVDTIERDLVIPARRLHLSDMTNDAVLTDKIVGLYNEIQNERATVRLSPAVKLNIGGPLEVMRRYISWLAEKDWDASSRVLKSDSPAFNQFRRDFRNMEGNDPVNGKERVYE